MGEGTPGWRSVSITNLEPMHVASVDYRPGAAVGDLHDEIRRHFEWVAGWVAEQGHDVEAVPRIGVLHLVGGQLAEYECCVPVPEEVCADFGEVGVRDLAGGRFAVVTIEKDPALVGAAIGRFYEEYVPQSGIELDPTRPTYEVYYRDTMEYCVPVR
jgi:DNA gyrase inhibitor GyrI